MPARDQSAVFRSLDINGSSPESGGLWYKSGDSKKTVCSGSEGWRVSTACLQEERWNNLKDAKDFYLSAEARIWP